MCVPAAHCVSRYWHLWISDWREFLRRRVLFDLTISRPAADFSEFFNMSNGTACCVYIYSEYVETLLDMRLSHFITGVPRGPVNSLEEQITGSES